MNSSELNVDAHDYVSKSEFVKHSCYPGFALY